MVLILMTRSIQLRPSSVSAAVLTAEERSKFKWLVVLFSKNIVIIFGAIVQTWLFWKARAGD
jgi:hypothetical protein